MPEAIRQAASMWRIKAEEIIQPEPQAEPQRKKDWECVNYGMETRRAARTKVKDTRLAR
jgi:hypothetical protein